MKEEEMKKIAFWINQVITDENNCDRVKEEIEELCKKFPLP